MMSISKKIPTCSVFLLPFVALLLDYETSAMANERYDERFRFKLGILKSIAFMRYKT